MKSFLKNQLLILISNSNNFHTNENFNLNVSDFYFYPLQNAYKVLENEKHDTELNLIRCQKYLRGVIKDKEDLESTLLSKNKEIEKLNNQIKEQEKIIFEKDKLLYKFKTREETNTRKKEKEKEKEKKNKKGKFYSNWLPFELALILTLSFEIKFNPHLRLFLH